MIHYHLSSLCGPVCISGGLLRGNGISTLILGRGRSILGAAILMETTRPVSRVTACGRAVALVALGLVLRCIPRDCIVQCMVQANMYNSLTDDFVIYFSTAWY